MRRPTRYNRKIDLRGRPDDNRRNIPWHFSGIRVVIRTENKNDYACNTDEDTEPKHAHDAQSLAQRQFQLLDLDHGENQY